MLDADFLAAQANRAQKARIDAAQAKIATAGSKVRIQITNSSGGSILVDEAALKNAMGTTAYNTLIATTKTAVSSALTSTESTVDSDFTAL